MIQPCCARAKKPSCQCCLELKILAKGKASCQMQRKQKSWSLRKRLRAHYNALTLNGQQVEEVKRFHLYLGSMVNTESNMMQGVNRRINIARTSAQKMDKIWKSKAVNYKLKLRLVRSTASAIASYGSESWTFSRKVQKKLNAFEMWTYRRLLHECPREREQMDGCSRG